MFSVKNSSPFIYLREKKSSLIFKTQYLKFCYSFLNTFFFGPLHSCRMNKLLPPECSHTTLRKGKQEIFVFERNSVSLKISLFSPYIWLVIWVQNSRLEILFCLVIWRHCSTLCELLLLLLRGPTMPHFPNLWMWAIFSRIFSLFWISEISQ